MSGHPVVGSSPENYEDQHRGESYRVRNKEGVRSIEYCAARNITVGNKLFKKRASHLITYESGPSKTQVDYCLVEVN